MEKTSLKAAVAHLTPESLTPEQQADFKDRVAGLHANFAAGSINWLTLIQQIAAILDQILNKPPVPAANPADSSASGA